MTYKLTTCPPRTGDNDADLASIFEWAAELSREREIDKRHIRDSLQDGGAGLTFPASDGSANQILETDGSGNLSFVDHGELSGPATLATYTDANRGAAGTAGRVIYNSDDGQLNVDDGVQWTLPDGTAT